MGRGPKGYRRSDERVHEDLCERIARSGVNADEVEVRVENGEVTLSGTVASRQEKRYLEDLCEDVFGVNDVHNQIRVSRGETSTGERTGVH
jgi:osmotically-inducible protein OsmY